MSLLLRINRILLPLVMLMLGACASHPSQTSGDPNVDRLEGFNRKVFAFNDTFDRWLLKPVAKGYRVVVPGPVKSGVGNFFDNLGEVSNIVNDGLQWKWGQAANDSGRLLLNSTFGLLGLFDVATRVGLEENPGEDFGQTLGEWGVPRGSYVMLPFLGPSTLRGTAAVPVDWALYPPFYLKSDRARYATSALNFVQTRYELLDAEDFASGDRYLFIREAYLQRLEFLENDGVVKDDFGDEFEDDDYGFDEDE